jgi:DNA/RNA endonuclease YhcR with UshA esterase domain
MNQLAFDRTEPVRKIPKFNAERAEKVKIQGYVEEVEMSGGNTEVVINDGSGDYLVVMDKTGQRLSNLLGQEVEVTGRVATKKGLRTIRITDIRSFDDYLDEAAYDYDD